MPLRGTYEPSALGWVREQVELYESSGGTRGTTLKETGLPVVVVTMIGRASGALRKVPVMRVEHEGEYLIVASKRGSAKDPEWADNLRADPRIMLQDRTERWDMVVTELGPEQRDQWWERAVAAFPSYADYQAQVERQIPLFLAERSANHDNGMSGETA